MSTGVKIQRFNLVENQPKYIQNLRVRAPGLSKYPIFNSIQVSNSADIYRGLKSIGVIHNQTLPKYREALMYAKNSGDRAGQSFANRSYAFVLEKMNKKLDEGITSLVLEAAFPGYQVSYPLEN